MDSIKRIILSEEQLKVIKENSEEITFYEFSTNMRDFIKGLLKNPLSCELPKFFKERGYTKKKMVEYLEKIGMIEKKSEKINMKVPEEPLYQIQYQVPRNNFDIKMRRIFVKLFECHDSLDNDDKDILNEEFLNERSEISVVKDVVNFLNKNYERGEEEQVSSDGKLTSKKVIGVKAKDNKGKNTIATNISPQQLFDRLEYELKDKIEKGEDRNAFIKRAIIDWYNETSGIEHGVLSKNIPIKIL
jgi:hypothetical protein